MADTKKEIVLSNNPPLAILATCGIDPNDPNLAIKENVIGNAIDRVERLLEVINTRTNAMAEKGVGAETDNDSKSITSCQEFLTKRLSELKVINAKGLVKDDDIRQVLSVISPKDILDLAKKLEPRLAEIDWKKVKSEAHKDYTGLVFEILGEKEAAQMFLPDFRATNKVLKAAHNMIFQQGFAEAQICHLVPNANELLLAQGKTTVQADSKPKLPQEIIDAVELAKSQPIVFNPALTSQAKPIDQTKVPEPAR